MYELISPIYSELFPSEGSKNDFIIAEAERTAETEGCCRVLDAGCADGELAEILAERGHIVTGIDISSDMIETARRRKSNLPEKTAQNLSFHKAGMQEISAFGNFELILCLGNTLPHLDSKNTVKSFLTDVRKSLSPSGCFIFQIMNFDRILKHRNVSFDEIRTASHIFNRDYEFTADNRIKFKIILTDIKTGQTESDSTELLPLSRTFLETELSTAGFDIIEVFSGFNGISADGTEFASVYIAR